MTEELKQEVLRIVHEAFELKDNKTRRKLNDDRFTQLSKRMDVVETNHLVHLQQDVNELRGQLDGLLKNNKVV